MTASDGRFVGPFPGQQTKFFERTEREVFYGGAGGGGKSVSLMAKFGQQLAVERARFERGEIAKSKAWGIYLRRTMPDLRQAIDKSYQFFTDIDPEAQYNVNDHLWVLPSCGDAHFQFGHMQTERDKYSYKSSEFSYIALDELTEFTETMYEYMDTRLRTTDKALESMLQICSGSNPDGVGLLWVRRRFIENREPEVIYRKRTTLRDGRIVNYDSVFIPAKLSDNPVLFESGQYEASLLNKRPEVREAILEGNWWVNPGAFLANIWDSRYHVCKNHDVPRGAKVFRSCDPAPSAPSSVTWWYVDKNGGYTGIHNLYVKNHDAAMLAARIREVEIFYGWWDDDGNRSTLSGPIDEDAFSKSNAGGPSYGKIHAQAGIRWRKAKKDRFNGTCEMVRRLNARLKPLHPGDDDVPLLRWMERCKAPIETIPILQVDPNDVNDVDSKGEDHCIAAYTIIPTKLGDIEIGSLVGTSGFVRDREGKWTPYRNCRLTRRNSPTVMVIFSDGARIQCTPDHRFRERGGRWVEAKDMEGRSCMVAESGGSPRATIETTTEKGCIDESGRMFMDQFHRAITSTIEMVARLTTGSKTWSVFRGVNTSRYTTPIPPFAGQPRGASPRPGAYLSSSTYPSSAQNAEPPSRSAGSTETGLGFVPGSAPVEANTPPSSPRIEATARCADAPSRSSPASARPSPAGTPADGLFVVAVLPASPIDVYCLEVPNGHEFALKNGAVISNCWDETRYACMDRQLPKAEKDEFEDDDDDNVVDMGEYRRRAGGGTLGSPPGGW